jgi:hypothetical protein
MLDKEKLIEEVENLPIYEFKNIFTYNSQMGCETLDEQKKFKAILEKDSKEALSIVTDRYKLIQFKEILLPIINGLGDLEGETKVHKGEGYTLIFPDEEKLNVKNGKLGLIIFNSVTKKYAVLIDFVFKLDNCYIVIPKKVKAFRNKHIGNAKDIINDYQKVLSNVKEEWETISNKFGRIISIEEYDFILGELKLGKSINKKIDKIFEDKEIILWDFIIEVMKNIQEKDYTSEVNKMRKIKFVSETIFKFSVIENLK